MTKISDFVALTAVDVDAATDLVTVVDASETGVARNKKMTFAELQVASTPIDTDGALAANSDDVVPSQKAVKAYVDDATAGIGGGDMLGSNNLSDVADPNTAGANIHPIESFIIACSDSSTALTAGTGKVSFGCHTRSR